MNRSERGGEAQRGRNPEGCSVGGQRAPPAHRPDPDCSGVPAPARPHAARIGAQHNHGPKAEQQPSEETPRGHGGYGGGGGRPKPITDTDTHRYLRSARPWDPSMESGRSLQDSSVPGLRDACTWD